MPERLVLVWQRNPRESKIHADGGCPSLTRAVIPIPNTTGNIPVTFATPPAAVINDTIEPPVEPRILKAIPVHSPAKTAASPAKARASSTPIAKAIPSNARERTNNDGEQ